MVAGDVHVTIVATPVTAASIDTALTALRVTGGVNGKYLMTTLENQVILAAIEET